MTLFTWLILLSSCQTELQTSEEFVEQFMECLKNQDNDCLYSKCYLSSKADIKKLTQEVTRSKKVNAKSIDNKYKATKEEKDRLYTKTRVSINPNSTIRIDSIIDSPQKIKGFGGDFDPSAGVRLNNISAFVQIDNESYKILFHCADLKSGQWKVSRHPEVTQLN